MSNDWVPGHSDNSENSGEFRVIAFMYRVKAISFNFSMTHLISIECIIGLCDLIFNSDSSIFT